MAADLQRPNAVTQLQVNGERAGVPVFAPEPGNGVGDPVDVARRSLEEAKRKLHDVVIVDTAGRLGVDAEMMAQAADIRDAVQPDEILFVVDAMIGQDAVTTAQAFLDGVGYDGVVLTKLDGDARGGAALSIASITGKPVMFASAGEKVTDFDVFHPDRMASRILDMGDVMTLIEQAEKTFDQEQALKAAEKLTGKGGEFTLDDFLEQMQQVRKLGSMQKIMGMLPGMGQFRDQLENFDEREIDRIQAIIRSMTPDERANPKMIDGSRRSRIARGSGRQVSDVNNLVDRFFEARKMMMSFAKGGGLPGMPGHARHGGCGRPQEQGQDQAGQGPPRVRQPGQGSGPGQGARGEGHDRRREPVREPGRRRDRLREGRGSARAAPGLQQVPQVRVLVVDSANVVGSRPDGWWKDRGAATRRLHERLMTADLSHDEVVLVLEGGARGGVRRGRDAHVRVTHASGTGDDAIVAEVTILPEGRPRGHRRHRGPDAPGPPRRPRRPGRRPELAARPARRVGRYRPISCRARSSRSWRCSSRTALNVQTLLSTNDTGVTRPITISCAQ